MTFSQSFWRPLRCSLLGLPMALCATAAMAGSPNVAISVEALPPVVSYARPQATPPLITYAAYAVKITNNSTNVINSVRFSARASVLTEGETTVFRETIGRTCSGVGSPAVDCPVGQMRGSGDSTSFVLVFDAPVAVASPLPGDRIDFAWTVTYGEGNNDSSGAGHTDTQAGVVATLLGTPTDTEVRGYVPSMGAMLYTGPNGVATAADPWTTMVSVPKAGRAGIVEAQALNSCSSDYLVCVTSTLDIPGSFAAPYLVITLRRDASTIKNGAKIANATLSYQPGVYDTAGNFVAEGAPVDIVSCDLLPGRVPNATHKRCIDYRTAYTKKTAPAPDFEGDWEFGLRALENGRISW
jgi:hypothetical protein